MPPDWKSAVRYLGGSEPREREMLAHMAREIRQVVADLTGDNGGVPRRALHAKPVATVIHAVIRVAADLPVEWRAGMLQPEATTYRQPWTRDRGEYYSLQWKPRASAAGDEGFKKP